MISFVTLMFTATKYSATDRRAIRRLFRKHRGAAAEVARRAGVQPAAISRWLSGSFISAKIEGYAKEVAAELTPAAETSIEQQRKDWLLQHPGVLTNIARRFNVTRPFVSDVWRGRRRSKNNNVERALLELGAPGLEEKTTHAA